MATDGDKVISRTKVQCGLPNCCTNGDTVITRSSIQSEWAAWSEVQSEGIISKTELDFKSIVLIDYAVTFSIRKDAIGVEDVSRDTEATDTGHDLFFEDSIGSTVVSLLTTEVDEGFITKVALDSEIISLSQRNRAFSPLTADDLKDWSSAKLSDRITTGISDEFETVTTRTPGIAGIEDLRTIGSHTNHELAADFIDNRLVVLHCFITEIADGIAGTMESGESEMGADTDIARNLVRINARDGQET